MARPLKLIDRGEFEKLCALQCTKSEICSWFDVTDKTLENWCRREYELGFSEVFAEKRGLGKISLRRKQFKLAEKSAAMAIFLGKNYLGQRDQHDITATAEGRLAELIDGLKEPCDDIYSETKGIDGAMENEQAPQD